jgi:hypothetical protein
MDTKKIRINKILKELPEKSGTNAKGPWTIYKMRANITVDGQAQDATVSSYSLLDKTVGTEVEVIEREYNGVTEYEITRRSAAGGGGKGGGGGWGGGGGYKKPTYTAKEFFSLEKFVYERAAKRFSPTNPQTVDPFKTLYATMLIQAAEHGVKIDETMLPAEAKK